MDEKTSVRSPKLIALEYSSEGNWEKVPHIGMERGKQHTCLTVVDAWSLKGRARYGQSG